MWIARLSLVALLLLPLFGCGKGQPSKPPTPTEDSQTTPRKDQSESSAPPPATYRTRLAHVPYTPSRVAVALAGLEGQSEDVLKALSRRWGKLIRIFQSVTLPRSLVEHALTGTHPPRLSKALADRLAPFDSILLLGRGRSGQLSAREWLHHLGRLSPRWHGGGQSVRHAALEGAEAVLSWSGRVVSIQGKTARLTVTGMGLLSGRPTPLKVGDFGPFDYHRPGAADTFQGIRGSFGRVTRLIPTALGTELEVRVLGWYTPKPGDRWRRLYLPGGTREIQVVSTEGAPQSGMVVYAHQHKFSKAHEDFAGTTDSEGKVQLEGIAGQIRYIQVVSTAEGVEFTFFQGILPVAVGLAPWVVQVADFSSLKTHAGEVRDRLLSGRQMQELRRKIQALLDTSSLLVRNGRFQKAVANMESSLKLLAGAQNKDASKLRQMVAQLKKKYEENQARERLIQSRTEILKGLARADEAIYSGQFSQGVTLLQDAQKRWPTKIFPERGALIAKKLAQAQRLTRDSQSIIGRARASLLQAINKLRQDQLKLNELDQLEPLVRVIKQQGVHDPKIPYSDAELLSRLKLKLDRISQAYVVELKRLIDAYNASMVESQRKELSERSDKIALFRERVDKLLGLLVLNK